MSLLAAFTNLDYSILGFYLIMMIAIGFYFSKEQETSKDFFLAGRSMGWFPVGLSVMATLLSAMSYIGIPAESYYVGFKFLLLPLSIWLLLPLVNKVVIPMYYNLGLSSVYEYLEFRFSLTTRMMASVMFVLWRLLWMGGVLYAPCKLLNVLLVDIEFVSLEGLIVTLGIISTLYTFLGGMKAVIWTDVIQSITMIAGVVLIIGVVLSSPGIDFQHVVDKATDLGRNEVFNFSFNLQDNWGFWTAVPHFLFAMLSFYVADQITAQRFLTTKNLKEVKKSFLLNCISNTLMVPALAFVGICLLVYYQANPQTMQPHWVANVRLDEENSGRGKAVVDPKSGKSVDLWTDTTAEKINSETIDKLVADKKIYRPNVDKPFENADELKNSENIAGINIERLATSRIHPSEAQEIVIHQKTKDELMPWFILNHLPSGVAGLILAALFAASMSSMDSGLNSISTLFIVDFHRRLGIGKQWLGARLKKPVEDLDEGDELKLGRPLVLIIGIAATLFSLWVSQIEDVFNIMIKVVNTFGGSLLSIFLLGMLTRRANQTGAMAALIFGTVYNIAMFYSDQLASLECPRPDFGLSDRWRIVLCVFASFIVGYIVSILTKNRNEPKDLAGLVLGEGELGKRQTES